MFGASINAAAVINEGTPERREPFTERETVWIGGFTQSVTDTHRNAR